LLQHEQKPGRRHERPFDIDGRVGQSGRNVRVRCEVPHISDRRQIKPTGCIHDGCGIAAVGLDEVGMASLDYLMRDVGRAAKGGPLS
jgi:hypothetical protein